MRLGAVVTQKPVTLPVPGDPSARRAWSWAFLVVAGLAGATIMFLGRTWSFFYDEWGSILYRRAGGLSGFLAPHNGHLQALGVLEYRSLFAVVGLREYWPYQVPLVLAHVLLGWLLFSYARRRVHSGLALAASIMFLFLGQGWEVLFWGYELGFVIPLICLVTVLAMRDSGFRTEPLLSGCLIALALASSAVGVAVAVAAGSDAALARRWRSLIGVVTAVLLYLGWFVVYRPSAKTPSVLRSISGADPNGDVGVSGASISHLGGVPMFMARAVQSSFFAVLGGHRLWSTPLVIITAAMLLGGLALRSVWTADGRGVSLLAGAATLWMLLGLARAGQPPNASRYLYVGAFFMLLMLVQALPSGGGVVLRAVAISGAVIVAGIGAVQMHRISSAATTAFGRQASALESVLCGGSTQPASYSPDPALLPGVTAGPLRAAVKDLGTPDRVSC